MLIRDDNEKVIGMLCVNYDTSALLAQQKELENFLQAQSTDTSEKASEDSAVVSPDIMSVIDDLIANIIGDQDVKNLTRKKCVEIVKFMDDKGIFLVKGAIDKVAELMGVSKVTIYSYLDEAKGKRR